MKKTRNRFKNIPFSCSFDLAGLVRVQKGKVVNRPLVENDRLTISLFSMDEGEGLETQSCPGDACFYVLEGEAQLNIGGKEVKAGSGKSVVIPADVPHTVTALASSKLLFTLVR